MNNSSKKKSHIDLLFPSCLDQFHTNRKAVVLPCIRHNTKWLENDSQSMEIIFYTRWNKCFILIHFWQFRKGFEWAFEWRGRLQEEKWKTYNVSNTAPIFRNSFRYTHFSPYIKFESHEKGLYSISIEILLRSNPFFFFFKKRNRG